MNAVHPGRRWVAVAAIAAVVVVADQLTKQWALSALAGGHIIDVVWTLRFKLAFNTGMSFSLGRGLGAFIAPLAAIVVVGLFWVSNQVRNRLGLFAIGLVVGGAVGNLIDRAFRSGDGFLGGGVVDFIDFQWWPIFNIADMGIVVGAALLLFSTWLERDDAYDDVDADEPDGSPSGAALGGDSTDEHDSRDPA